MNKKIKLILLFSIPAISIIASILHAYEIIEPKLCIIYHLTGQQCLGCGLTRASLCMIRFDFVAAWGYNKMVFFIFPAISLGWLKLAINQIKSN